MLASFVNSFSLIKPHANQRETITRPLFVPSNGYIELAASRQDTKTPRRQLEHSQLRRLSVRKFALNKSNCGLLSLCAIIIVITIIIIYISATCGPTGWRRISAGKHSGKWQVEECEALPQRQKQAIKR